MYAGAYLHTLIMPTKHIHTATGRLGGLCGVEHAPALNPGHHAVSKLAEVWVNVAKPLAYLVCHLQVALLRGGAGLAEGHVLEEGDDLLLWM